MRYLLLTYAFWLFPVLGSNLFTAETSWPEVYPQRIAPLVDQYCLDCHDDLMREGGLDLTGVGVGLEDIETFRTWEKVHDKLRSEAMPPEDKPQPSDNERALAVAGLESALIEAAESREGDRPVYRRLTRFEFEHTLRDLLSLSHLDVRTILPADGRAHGFDRVADALKISHVQIASYLEAAEVALNRAIVESPETPERIRERFSFHEQYVAGHGVRYGVCIPMAGRELDATFNAAKGVKREDRDQAPFCTALGVIRGGVPGSDLKFAVDRRLKEAGVYKLRVRVWSFDWDRGKVLPSGEPRPVKWFAGERPIGYVDAPSLEPTEHEMTTWINPGEKISFNPASIPLRPPVTNQKQRDQYAGPGVAVEWIEIEGPLHESWPPESHRRLFGALPLERKRSEGKTPEYQVVSKTPNLDAQRLLKSFINAAFRRSAPSAEVERYFQLFRRRHESGHSFQDALLSAYKAILCSPDFLFLRFPQDDFDLAAQLASFLWSSRPDQRLLDLATRNALSAPETLRRETDRMIDDPRFRRFVEDFTDQWLELRDIDFTMPDADLYPEFSPWLRDSMLSESRAFFQRIARENRPIMDFVDSDWAMLNARLAVAYGVEGVEGVAFRPVQLPENSPRGGVMTQASVLKVTANGTVTSPVTRGIWVLENLLGRPPDPPPPGITAVDPDTRGVATIRERLAKHRDTPSCASCHKYIDPPGFALESFDVIGGWRERYRAVGNAEPVDAKGFDGKPVKFHLAQPVDSAGEMANGEAFSDILGLKKLLLAERHSVARCVAEKLLIYATGRSPHFGERMEVERLVDRVLEREGGMRDLIHRLVQSPLFQQQRD